MSRRELNTGWVEKLASFPTEKDGKPNAISTRAASGKVLNGLADILPELWGGSADLAESNNTTMDGQPSFVPAEHQTKDWPGGPYGRTLHFGIREHAMGAIMNGIALHAGPACTAARSSPSPTTRAARAACRTHAAAGHIRVDARLPRA